LGGLSNKKQEVRKSKAGDCVERIWRINALNYYSDGKGEIDGDYGGKSKEGKGFMRLLGEGESSHHLLENLHPQKGGPRVWQ